jgi:RNA polymerase sigma-70 factor (ECF subfamily)
MHDLDNHQRNGSKTNRPKNIDERNNVVDWRFEGNNLMGVAVMEMPELIQAARGGDDRAFDHLISHYHAAAQRLAQQILRTEEAAADAVQDALIKVHRALPRFQDGNFRSWLLRIVTNTCYDYLRSQRRRAAISLDDLTEPSNAEFPQLQADELQNPEVFVTQQESLQFLHHSIDILPSWHRDVVLLVDVHGYDYTEAAEMLGLPLGTVKSRLSRARSALRDQLLKAGYVSTQAAPLQ